MGSINAPSFILFKFLSFFRYSLSVLRNFIIIFRYILCYLISSIYRLYIIKFDLLESITSQNYLSEIYEISNASKGRECKTHLAEEKKSKIATRDYFLIKRRHICKFQHTRNVSSRSQ